MKFLSKLFSTSNKETCYASGKGASVSEDGKLLIVCDSKDQLIDPDEVCRKLQKEFFNKFNKSNIKGTLRESLQNINAKIYKEGKTEISVVCYYADEKKLIIGQVGNAALYVYGSGELKQITDEDTQAYELFKMGIIEYERLKKHPLNKNLSSALGRNEVLLPNMHEFYFTENDKVLIANDVFFDKFSLQNLEDYLTGESSIIDLGEKLKLESEEQAAFIIKQY